MGSTWNAVRFEFVSHELLEGTEELRATPVIIAFPRVFLNKIHLNMITTFGYDEVDRLYDNYP
jgi:hypothetical protein